jgi:hypothetical protein
MSKENLKCEHCKKGLLRSLLDVDGTRSDISGRVGYLQHAVDDAFWPCPDVSLKEVERLIDLAEHGPATNADPEKDRQAHEQWMKTASEATEALDQLVEWQQQWEMVHFPFPPKEEGKP